MLARSKLNSIEKLVPESLIDLEIIQEEYKLITNEKENYRRLREIIRMMKSSNKKDELSENDEIYLRKYWKCIELKKNKCKMIEITKETSGQSDVELIVLNGKKWLTEKNIEVEIRSGKFSSSCRKIPFKI